MTGERDPLGEDWVYVSTSALPDPATYADLGIVAVDGETFAVRERDTDGSVHYAWISGPNADYGFSTSGNSGQMSQERHEAAIRDFLHGIDPETGYLSYP